MGYRRAGLGIMNVSSKNNDIMSSYENESDTNARWYHDADGKGRCVTMLAYRSDNDINTWDDDELTSWATILLIARGAARVATSTRAVPPHHTKARII